MNTYPVRLTVQTRSRSRLEEEEEQRNPQEASRQGSVHNPSRIEEPEDLGPLAQIPEWEPTPSSEVSIDFVEEESEELSAENKQGNFRPEFQASEMAESRNPLIVPGRFKGGFEDNAENYLAHFERIAKANGWDNNKKLVIIPCYLEGAALKWYENIETTLGDGITWDRVKSGMREAFQTIAWDEQLEFKLRMRMQGEDEPVESYFQDVINLCAKVDPDMSERSRIKHVLRGLNPSLLEKVMVLDNDNLENLLKNIRKVQTARYMAGQRVDNLLEVATRAPIAHTSAEKTSEAPISTSKLESQLQSLAADFSKLSMRLLGENRRSGLEPAAAGGSGDPENRRSNAPFDRRGGRPPRFGHSRGGRTSDGRVICYRCNKVGHFAINCRSNQGGESGNERGSR